MKDLTIRHVTEAAGGQYFGPSQLLDTEITAITTDSRSVESGCLFVPIVGKRVDGHSFIPAVMEAGALVTLSERPLDGACPYILVASSREAIKAIARYYLASLGIPVVGITGSVGKTSTKEAIYAVLKEKYRVLKTEGNFNNELGLPLTIFRLREGDEMAVLEMGISDFGEMSRLADIARPHTAVITNIGTAHLQNLKDRDGVLKAKTEILDYVRDNGHIVLNGDDDKLVTVGPHKGISPIFYGFSPENNIYADSIESLGLRGSRFVIHMEGEAIPAKVSIPGQHMIANALAAAAVGRLYGLSWEEICRGLLGLSTISGRMRLIESENYLIVDDCYNANPVSMKAALDVMKQADGRRVAILGDMKELGDNERAFHREVGAYAASCGVSLLILAGPLCAAMAEGAGEADPSLEVVYYETTEELVKNMKRYLRPGDTVLVKASHSMGFERVLEALKN